MRWTPVFVLVLSLCTAAGAQQPGARAWQQRLHIREPLPVPVLAVPPANPFATPVEVGPRLVAAAPPRRLEVTGRVKVGVYVNTEGRCPGAVPLELPFSGLTEPLLAGLRKARFTPAKAGSTPRPAWAVLEIVLAGRIKQSAVSDQHLSLPDPRVPPAPPTAAPPYPAGNLASLPAADPATLTQLPVPRKVRVRVPGGRTEVGVHALVHLTADGRCDRFVPLDMRSGFVPWLGAYLATWRVQPAQVSGRPVACWMEYRARVAVKLSSLSSRSVKVLPGERFHPAAEARSGGSPAGR